jgi:hypothetical protein
VAVGRIDVEDVARAVAEEAGRAVERLTQIDLEELARAASVEVGQARRWIDELGRSVRV